MRTGRYTSENASVTPQEDQVYLLGTEFASGCVNLGLPGELEKVERSGRRTAGVSRVDDSGASRRWSWAARPVVVSEETVNCMDDDPFSGYGLRPVELADRAVLEPFFASLREPISDFTFSQLFT